MDNYQRGWEEALLVIKDKRCDSRSFSYWDGRLDASNLTKKKIWIKNPEVKGGGFFQERKVSNEVSKPKPKVKSKEKEKPKIKLIPFVHPSQMPELSPVSAYTPHPNPEVEKQLQAFAEQHSLDRTETLAMIDSATGELIDKTSDDNKTSVRMSNKMKDEERQINSITIHNHPTIEIFKGEKIKTKTKSIFPDTTKTAKEHIETGQYPDTINGIGFSPNDIISGLSNNESEVHVISPVYHYVMKFPEFNNLPDYKEVLKIENETKLKLEELNDLKYLPMNNEREQYYATENEKLQKQHFREGKFSKDEYIQKQIELQDKYLEEALNPDFGEEQENQIQAYSNLLEQISYSKEYYLSRKIKGLDTLTTDGGFLDDVKSVINATTEEVETKLIPELKQKYGDHNIETEIGRGQIIYSFDYWHEVMTRVADKFGFEYKKMKRNNVPEAKIKQQLLNLYGDKK